MAYSPGTNIVVSGKTFINVPSVKFKTPDGDTVNFAHITGQLRVTPELEEYTQQVTNFESIVVDPVTSTLLSRLDSDFVAENIKKDVDLFGLMGTFEGGDMKIGDIHFVGGTIIFSETPTGDVEIPVPNDINVTETAIFVIRYPFVSAPVDIPGQLTVVTPGWGGYARTSGSSRYGSLTSISETINDTTIKAGAAKYMLAGVTYIWGMFYK